MWTVLQTLEKTGGDADYIDKAKNSVAYWKGLCLRNFDYSTISLYQLDQLEYLDEHEETEEDDKEIVELRLK